MRPPRRSVTLLAILITTSVLATPTSASVLAPSSANLRAFASLVHRATVGTFTATYHVTDTLAPSRTARSSSPSAPRPTRHRGPTELAGGRIASRPWRARLLPVDRARNLVPGVLPATRGRGRALWPGGDVRRVQRLHRRDDPLPRRRRQPPGSQRGDRERDATGANRRRRDHLEVERRRPDVVSPRRRRGQRRPGHAVRQPRRCPDVVDGVLLTDHRDQRGARVAFWRRSRRQPSTPVRPANVASLLPPF